MSLQEGTSVTPYLPSDIEREIFELTVREFSGIGPLLCLVAGRVHTWIQPLLYTVIIYRGRTEYPNLAQRKGERVRYLLLGGISWDYQISWFIKRCPNLRSLALWPSPLRTLPAEDVRKTLLSHSESRLATDPNSVGLTNLSVEFKKWFETKPKDFESLIFKDLTHLDLMDPVLRNWDEWKGLSRLPALTHLAINRSYSIPFLKNLLEKCQRLVVVVIITNTAWCVEHGNYRERRRVERQRRQHLVTDESIISVEDGEVTQEGYVGEKVDDGRLVFLEAGQAEQEWHNAAHGLVSFWDKAEDMVYAQLARSQR